MTDKDWMQRALALAERAEQEGEVPIGAVLVKQDRLIGEGWNKPIGQRDPTAHAEIIALRQAGEILGNYRLPETSLFVTLEPCLMCMGAIMQARVHRLVFGAFDPNRGAVCSALNLADSEFLNHSLEWRGGLLAAECGNYLKKFFQARR